MWQVIGHSLAVDFLQRCIWSNRIGHAFLFIGQSQVGKRTLAINLAQALNCLAEDESRPCGQCSACRRIAAGNFADFQIIDLLIEGKGKEGRRKKEIGIEQVRDLQRAAVLQPYEGRYKVFIINNAESLSTEAANALLKTLEEPPEHAVLILLTIDDKLLLPTVVSRCQRVDLRPVAQAVVEEALVTKWGAPIEKARLLSRLCQGRIGWAVAALANSNVLEKRTSAIDQITEVMAADRFTRLEHAARLANQFGKDRQIVKEELELWQSWWRDLMLVKAGCSELLVNHDRSDEIERQAARYSLGEIKEVIDFLRLAWEQLDQNANPRLALEVFMLRLPNGRN